VPKRENYYLVLDLDPSVDEWPLIEQRIREKRAQWGRDMTTGVPTKARPAERYTEEIKQIEAVMRDPEQRAAEAQAARAALRTRREQKEKDLLSAIDVLSRGKVTQADVDKLVRRFKDVGAPEALKTEILSALRERNVEVDDARARPKRKPREQIDDAEKQPLASNLEIAGAPDLYTYLGLGRQTSAEALYRKADEINQELLTRKGSAEVQAGKALCGLAMAFFKTEEGRQRYDNTLELACMDGLRDRIEIAGRDKYLSKSELDELLRQAREEKVATELALEYIEAFADKQGWVVQSDEELPSEKLLTCGFCGALAAYAAREHCGDCGEPLRLACPRCSAPTPTQDRACGACGCVTGDAPVVMALLKQAQERLAGGAAKEAEELFDAALTYWKDWQPALEGKRAAQQRIAEREAGLRSIQALVRDRNLFAARDAHAEFVRAHGQADGPDLGDRIRQGIEQAEEAFRAAESARVAKQLGEAFAKYDQALSHAADYDQVRHVMSNLPPPAPKALTVQSVVDGFHLSWPGVEAPGAISYRVVRKRGATPSRDDDGDLVGELSASEMDDVGPEVGAPFHYAVFSHRSGASSVEAARAGPFLLTADVGNLQILPGPKQATLSWTLPSGCKRVIVRRKRDGIPESDQDGVEVPASGTSAHDTGLENGVTYGYVVAAVFEDPRRSGREIVTAGVSAKIRPVELPPLVEDLACQRSDGLVTLAWTPPGTGTVQIRWSKTAPAEGAVGQVMSLTQMDQLGALVPARSAGSAQIALEGQGRFFFVPLSISGDLAVVGRAATLTTVGDVANVDARAAGRNLILTWDWPAGVEEVVVAYAHDRPPAGPDDARAKRETVTRRGYDRASCWELQHAERKPHYFRLYAKAPEADAFAAGVGAHVSFGKERVVHCRVVTKKSVLRKTKAAHLELRSSDVECLRNVVLVMNRGQVPISSQKGRRIAQLPEVVFEDGVARIPIPEEHWGPKRYFRLFFRDSTAAPDVRLMHAGKEQLALG